MRFMACLTLVALASPCLADEEGISPLDRAREQKQSGIAITAVGVGLEAGGLALLTASALMPSCAFALGAPEEGACAPGSNGPQKSNSGTAQGLFIIGAAAATAATVIVAVGVPVWARSAHQEKKLRRALSIATGTITF